MSENIIRVSNTPIFDQINQELAARGTSYEDVSKFSTPAFVWGPRFSVDIDREPEDLTVKPPLPKRPLKGASELIERIVPETQPEFVKQFQDFIASVPQQLLAGTPGGSFIESMAVVPSDNGGLRVEADVMVPVAKGDSLSEIVRNMIESAMVDQTMQLRVIPEPKTAMVLMDLAREWETVDPEEDEIYIAPSTSPEPIVMKGNETIYSDFKEELVREDIVKRQLDFYRSASPFFRQKAAQPVMTEENRPSWVTDEVQRSNEYLGDSEPVEEQPKLINVYLAENIPLEDVEGAENGLVGFYEALMRKYQEKFPNSTNHTIQRKDENNGSITISVSGTTPEQTDESVNAASNHASTQTIVKPLWVTNEE